MHLPDKFLITYTPSSTTTIHFSSDTVRALMRFGKSSPRKPMLDEFTRSSYLFIGYAALSEDDKELLYARIDNIRTVYECLYPVYYNLNNGKTYLAANRLHYSLNDFQFRNAVTEAIYFKFRFKTVDSESFLTFSEDLELSLDKLELVNNTQNLPCKILAWIYSGSGKNITAEKWVQRLPVNANLLVACGKKIAMTNPAELERLSFQNKITLLIDNESNVPTIPLVYIGDTGNDPRRISYAEDKGIICDYAGLDYLYFQGTQDKTPNTAIGTQDVCKSGAIVTTASPLPSSACYINIDLRDSHNLKFNTLEPLMSHRLCHYLERLKLPRHWVDCDLSYIFDESCVEVCRTLVELVLPEELPELPYLGALRVSELTLPKKLKCLDLARLAQSHSLKKLTIPTEYIPKVMSSYPYSSVSLMHLETLNCPQRVLHAIADVVPDYWGSYNLKIINKQPAYEYIKELNAVRVLCGAPLIVHNLGEQYV